MVKRGPLIGYIVFLYSPLQKIGPQKMDDGKIEIVGFWSSTFVSLYTCKVEAFKVFSSFVASLSAPQVEGKQCAIF